MMNCFMVANIIIFSYQVLSLYGHRIGLRITDIFNGINTINRLSKCSGKMPKLVILLKKITSKIYVLNCYKSGDMCNHVTLCPFFYIVRTLSRCSCLIYRDSLRIISIQIYFFQDKRKRFLILLCKKSM